MTKKKVPVKKMIESQSELPLSAAKKKPAPKKVAPVVKKAAPVKKKDGEPRYELLNSWMLLNDEIKNMSEAEAFALIDRERETRLRPNVLLRLHGRGNKLRGAREKAEIMRKK